MGVARTYGNPSTLAGVLRQVRDLFAASGDATPIAIGKQYLSSFGVGSAPRVLFVPEPRGAVGPAIEIGNAASMTHSCTAYVRGAESGDDFGRFDAAYALCDKTISSIRRVAAGHLEFGDMNDGSPTDANAYGADVVFAFTYQRDVRHDEAIMSVPSAALDTTPPRPIIPPGIAADGFEIIPTVSPQLPPE